MSNESDCCGSQVFIIKDKNEMMENIQEILYQQDPALVCKVFNLIAGNKTAVFHAEEGIFMILEDDEDAD